MCSNHAIDIATAGKQGGDHGNQYTGGKHDNIMLATQGTSATYALRKLRKDAPEIHARELIPSYLATLPGTLQSIDISTTVDTLFAFASLTGPL